MKKNKKKLILLLSIVAAGIGMACAGTLAYLWFGPLFRPTDTAYLYIDRDDTIDSIYYKVEKTSYLSNISRKYYGHYAFWVYIYMENIV